MLETLGQRLLRLRKNAGLTQIEVSAETGIARTHLSKMERSSHPGTWDAMCQLSDLYNVSLDYLRFGDEFPANGPETELIKNRSEIALLRAFRVLNNDEQRAFAILVNNRFVRESG